MSNPTRMDAIVSDIAGMPRCEACELPLIQGNCPYCATQSEETIRGRLYRVHELASELLTFAHETADLGIVPNWVSVFREADDVLAGMRFRGVEVTVRRVLLNCFLGAASLDCRVLLVWLATRAMREPHVTAERVLQVARLHLEAADG